MMKKLSRNIFILETALFAINFYFGIYSLFDMIPDKINIKLYHLLFRDDEKTLGNILIIWNGRVNIK